MSAFIVSNECINRIVTKLYINKHRDYSLSFQRLADVLNVNPSALSEEMIGQALYKMNCEAVGARYGKYEDMVGEPYKYSPEFNYRLIQVYKDINSLSYQCSEGNVPESELYKWLNEFESTVAKNIISAMPEYDQATWGD